MSEAGKKCKLNYVLKIDGQVVQTTADQGPMEFQLGQGQLLPAFEAHVEQLEAGGKTTFKLKAEEAYGAINPKAIVLVERKQFRDEKIEVGMMFSATAPNGDPLRGTIKEVQEEKVLVDFNHPLAGKELEFDVEVIEIG